MRCAKALLDARADPNLPCTDDEPLNGRRALHFAAESGLKELIDVLVDAGADHLAVDAGGKTAMRLAKSFSATLWIEKAVERRQTPSVPTDC